MTHSKIYPLIVYRKTTGWTQEEENAASKWFVCSPSRCHAQPYNLVIGRYSVLPFYKEFENDLNIKGAQLINSYQQHEYVADIFKWYEDLKDLTPRTWRSIIAATNIGYGGPFVVKGETNSKKFLWDTHMYCKDKNQLRDVLNKLFDDSLISQQKIAIREYVPLVTYMKSLYDLPITKEFRVFVAYGKVLCGAYYWASHAEDLAHCGIKVPTFDEVPKSFLNKITNAVGNKINFYVVDVAQAENGEWIVIELNDGQMSGLSMNDPNVLYENLYNQLTKNDPIT